MITKIVIIGGHEHIIPFIDILLNIENINLIGICDSDENSPVLKYAKGKNINVSTNYADFIFNKDIDLVIESSGSKEFQKILLNIIPHKTKIVDFKAIEIIFEILKNEDTLR